MEIVEILFETAKKDLQASKYLYNNALYPQAIFHIQQSVEKATKCFGMIFGIISEKELKKIGHNPIKIYEKEYEKMADKNKELTKLIEYYPNIEKTQLIKKIVF